MKRLLLILLLLPVFAKGQMRVYTVAGSDTAHTYVGSGQPATNAALSSTEGLWMDGSCNLYITQYGTIRKVSTVTGIMTTLAGEYSNPGFSGDGGPATNAQLHGVYGLYCDATGNLFLADEVNNRIRRVDAGTGIITTYAGGGSSLANNIIATSAQLINPVNVYGDAIGNIYIAGGQVVRKVNVTTGIITTVAGTGISGYSGDGGPATNAELFNPMGMIFDSHNNLYIAERGNAVIRKVNMTTGIISTVVGTTAGYSGDGGPATNAQISNLNSFTIDDKGNLIIGDLQNNVIRKVDAITGIINTIAGDTSITATSPEGAPATSTAMHPEFIYLDLSGNLYYSCFCQKIRKITNFTHGLAASGSRCGSTGIQNVIPLNNKVELYPNPATAELTIIAPYKITNIAITNLVGQTVYNNNYHNEEVQVDVSGLPTGMYLIRINGTEVRKLVKE